MANFHGRIKSVGEWTSVDYRVVHGSGVAVSCHPNVVGVDFVVLTGEDYEFEMYSTLSVSDAVVGWWF